MSSVPELDVKPAVDGLDHTTAGDRIDLHSGEGLRSKWEDVSMRTVVIRFWKAMLFSSLAAMSAACDGYQIAINGNVIANPGFIATFGNQTNPTTGAKILSASTLSAFSAMISVGQILGMTSLPFVMDRFGRKIAMYTFLTILALSIAFESAAKTWPLWLVGKLFAGIGVGSMQLCLPTYIAEISPVKTRGAMVALYNVWWSIGLIFAPVALQVLGQQNPDDWKTPVYSQWGLIILMAIIYVLIVPESPWWACEVGQHGRGKQLLGKINGHVPAYDVEEEYAILTRTVELEKELAIQRKNESFTAIFNGVNGLRTLAGIWSLVASQFLGLALIGTYTTYLFLLAGYNDPFRETIITGCLNFAGVIFTLFTVDGIGRYWLLNGAMMACWISIIVIGGLSLIKDPSQGVGGALIFLPCLWSFANSVNYSVSWSMMAEVASARLRAKTAGFAAACSAVAGVTFVVITPYLINVNNANWGLKTCFFFFGTGTLFVFGGWFIIPETARRSPAELDELYETGVKPWKFRNTVTQIQIKRGAEELVEPQTHRTNPSQREDNGEGIVSSHA